mgnify:CR=1 FL=1
MSGRSSPRVNDRSNLKAQKTRKAGIHSRPFLFRFSGMSVRRKGAGVKNNGPGFMGNHDSFFWAARWLAVLSMQEEMSHSPVHCPLSGSASPAAALLSSRWLSQCSSGHAYAQFRTRLPCAWVRQRLKALFLTLATLQSRAKIQAGDQGRGLSISDCLSPKGEFPDHNRPSPLPVDRDSPSPSVLHKTLTPAPLPIVGEGKRERGLHRPERIRGEGASSSEREKGRGYLAIDDRACRKGFSLGALLRRTDRMSRRLPIKRPPGD